MNFLSFLRKKDESEFLIIYAGATSLSALSCTLTKERELRLGEMQHTFDPRILARGMRGFQDNAMVILAVSPQLVHHAAIPIEWLRWHSLRPIEATEAENAFGQEVGKHFNEVREAAGRALGALPVDTVLMASRVRDLALDGHRAIDPVGFTAQRVHAVVDLAFVSRTFHAQFAELFRTNPVFVTDTARAGLAALLITCAPPLTLLTPLGEFSAAHSVYEKEGARIFEAKEFVWSDHDLLHALIVGFGVGAGEAEVAYAAYLKKEKTKTEREAIEKKLKPPVKAFLAAVSRAKLGGKVFGAFRRPLPPFVPRRHRKATFDTPRIKDIFGEIGVRIVDERHSFSDEALFLALAPFVDFYTDKGDAAMNKWLKRRLHWLGAVKDEMHGDLWGNRV